MEEVKEPSHHHTTEVKVKGARGISLRACVAKAAGWTLEKANATTSQEANVNKAQWFKAICVVLNMRVTSRLFQGSRQYMWFSKPSPGLGRLRVVGLASQPTRKKSCFSHIWCWAELPLEWLWAACIAHFISSASLQIGKFWAFSANLHMSGDWRLFSICASNLLQFHVISQSEICKEFVFLDLLAMASYNEPSFKNNMCNYSLNCSYLQ